METILGGIVSKTRKSIQGISMIETNQTLIFFNYTNFELRILNKKGGVKGEP